jgi:hypothetical protein
MDMSCVVIIHALAPDRGMRCGHNIARPVVPMSFARPTVRPALAMGRIVLLGLFSEGMRCPTYGHLGRSVDHEYDGLALHPQTRMQASFALPFVLRINEYAVGFIRILL